MLQFKIYINKITYIASVYLIKVEGGGGVGSVKVFMSSMCVSRMVFVLSEVGYVYKRMCYITCQNTFISYRRTTQSCPIYAEKPKVIYEKTWNDFKTYVRDKNCVNTKLNL